MPPLSQAHSAPLRLAGRGPVAAATGQPWSAAADGLHNITGRVNPNGTVTIWAITSTVSGGDQGADPNKLVAITDRLSASAPGAAESFRTVRAAGAREVLRGVSFTPGTPPRLNRAVLARSLRAA